MGQNKHSRHTSDVKTQEEFDPNILVTTDNKINSEQKQLDTLPYEIESMGISSLWLNILYQNRK